MKDRAVEGEAYLPAVTLVLAMALALEAVGAVEVLAVEVMASPFLQIRRCARMLAFDTDRRPDSLGTVAGKFWSGTNSHIRCYVAAIECSPLDSEASMLCCQMSSYQVEVQVPKVVLPAFVSTGPTRCQP